MTLLDDQTGKRTHVKTYGCEYLAFGPPSILFQCPAPDAANLWVYNITTHKRTHVPCAVAACTPLFQAAFIRASVGARWIFVVNSSEGSCGDGLHYSCGPLQHTFINIRTGRLRYFYDQLSSTRIMDLNAPYATRVLCQGVRAGAVAGPGVPYADPVTFYGTFAATYTLSGQSHHDRHNLSRTLRIKSAFADRPSRAKRIPRPYRRERPRGRVGGLERFRRVRWTGWAVAPEPSTLHCRVAVNHQCLRPSRVFWAVCWRQFSPSVRHRRERSGLGSAVPACRASEKEKTARPGEARPCS